MGFFSLTQDIARDLGTANTIITVNDKVLVDEPSVVALDKKNNKMIAVGHKAKMMYGKEHEGIRTCRPLRDGHAFTPYGHWCSIRFDRSGAACRARQC